MTPSGLVFAHSAVLIDTGTVAVPFGGTVTNCPVEIAGVNALNLAVPGS